MADPVFSHGGGRGRGCAKLRERCANLLFDKILMPGADPGFGQGWPQLPRLKVADVAEWSKLSATEVQGLLKGPRSFWVFIAQIYTFSHILETPFL